MKFKFGYEHAIYKKLRLIVSDGTRKRTIKFGGIRPRFYFTNDDWEAKLIDKHMEIRGRESGLKKVDPAVVLADLPKSEHSVVKDAVTTDMLDKHVTEAEETFACDHCGSEPFESQDDLDQHLRLKHQIGFLDEKEPEPEKPKPKRRGRPPKKKKE